jgi:L-aspartate oxidase
VESSGKVIAVDSEPQRTAEIADRAELQALMWEFAGIERNGHGLKEAALRLSLMRGSDESVDSRETANLLEIACAMVRMALQRCESRGAHFRVDYPETLAEFAHPLVCATEARKVAACL